MLLKGLVNADARIVDAEFGKKQFMLNLLPLFQCPAQPDIPDAQPGYEQGQQGIEFLHVFNECPAPARHPVQSGKILLRVEAVSLCLFAEKVVIRNLIVEEKLAEKKIGDMPAADNDGGNQVPHAVFAFIESVLPFLDRLCKTRVTFFAVREGLGMDTVEPDADVLPAGCKPDVAVHIGHCRGNPGHFVKGVHQLLESLEIYQLPDILLIDVHIRQQGVLKLGERFSKAARILCCRAGGYGILMDGRDAAGRAVDHDTTR